MIQALLVAFTVGLAATYLLMRAEGRLKIVDVPNHRSLHSTPTPRTGGLAICLAAILGIVIVRIHYAIDAALGWVAVGAVLVGIISFLDDRSHVPAGLRLATHLGAAAMVVNGVALLTLIDGNEAFTFSAIVGLALTLVFVTWMINLYNFMDGMDGFAGGMAFFGFGAFGLLGYMSSDIAFAALNWTIMAAVAGFLIWNFPPARIFMGDTGSSILGLTAAGMALWADSRDLFPLWISMLVFSLFIVDASVTLIRRLFHGERVWEAHRSHYYQRLVQAGWGHRKTVLCGYGLMAGSGVAGIVAYDAPAGIQWIIIASWVAVYVGIACSIGHIEARAAARHT